MKLLLTVFLLTSTAIAAFSQTDSTANLYRFTTEEHLLTLEQESVNSERIIRNAVGETETLRQSSYPATVITAAEIQASGASNIAEILRLSPLLSVSRSGNEVYNVRIPGSPVSDLTQFLQADFLVLIDEIPFNDPTEGQIFWEHIPLEINQIERIEIFLGPASERFGPRAASGVISIISRQLDAQHTGGEADLMYSDPNLYRYSAHMRFSPQQKINVSVGGRYDYSKRNNKESYLFDLQRFTSIDSLPFFQENAPNTHPSGRRSSENYGLNARVLIKLNSKSTVLLHGSQMYNLSQGIFDRTGQIAHQSRSAQTTQFGLKANLLSMTLLADFKLGKRDYAIGYPGRQFDFREGILRLSHKKAFSERVRMQSGLEWQYNYLKNTGNFSDEYVSFLDAPTLSQQVLSAFTALEATFGKWRPTLDIRADNYSLSGQTFVNIRPAVTYRLTEAQQLRLSYSSGQSGNYFRNFHENSETKVLDLNSESRLFLNRLAVSDPNLQLMSIRAINMGWRYQKNKFYIDLNLFSRQYENAFMSEIENVPTGILRKLSNRQTAFRQNGLTLSGHLDLVNLECLAYFSLLSTPDSPANAQANWSGGLNLIYSAFFNKLKINIQTQFREHYAFSSEKILYQVPLRLSGDAKVSYKFFNKHAVFVSYRSFLQESAAEMPFGDPIEAFYILGLHLSL